MFSPRKDPDSGGTMTLASPKSLSSLLALPRSLSSIVISLGGLALFLVVASRLLISYPIGSAVHERVHELLIGVDHSRGPPIVSPFDPTGNSGSSRHSEASRIGERGLAIENPASRSGSSDGAAAVRSASAGGTGEEAQTVKSPISQSGTEDAEIARSSSPSFSNDSSKTVSSEEFGNAAISSSNPTVMVPVPPQVSSDRKADSRSCDLYRGKWVYDSDGPLYTNNTCPIITQMQNCQGNGRPDKNYENWRWKPNQCNLPHFDANKFLELMRGKTLAFVGDSVARNQMESMLCILWQVEAPKNRGTRKMHRWYFKSTSTTIVRLWSSWLVHLTNEPIQFAPEGIVKLHLDLPDETFMEFLPRFDVVVLSSGHWFAKQSVYILNDTIVGWQLWKPPEEASQQPLIGSGEAYGISVETALTAIATHPNYSGLTIVRSFSPDHYEGGAWNTGGSCTGKDQPATEVVRNGFTDSMHEKQVRGFESVVAAKKAGNGSKLRLLDITEMFGYRHDGHPGPYRNLDPNKVTKRGPDGKPPPQDCLHWCMPGPVDTWNELVLEIIRREFEGAAAA